MKRRLLSLCFVISLRHVAWGTPDLNLVSAATSPTAPGVRSETAPGAYVTPATSSRNNGPFSASGDTVSSMGGMAPLAPSGPGTPQLNIVSGASNIIIPGMGNQVVYSNDVNGWNVSLAFGLSNSPNLSGTPGGFGLELTSASATCFGGGCSTDPLQIFLSDTNFVGMTSSLSSYFSSTQTGVGTSSQKAWFDNSNTLFGSATPIGNVGPFTGIGAFAGSASGPGPAGTSPYSLTIEDVFNPNGGPASFGSSGDITGISTVPEPSSLTLFGTLLIVCASRLLRRSKSRLTQ